MKRNKSAQRKESSDAKASAPAANGLPEPTVGVSKTRYAVRLCAIAVGLYVLMKQQKAEQSTRVLAADSHRLRRMNVTCAKDYGPFPGCSPHVCGRAVMDQFANDDEIKGLIDIANRGMSRGGGAGGATILDLHSGALSRGKEFINLYKSVKGAVFNEEDFALYKTVKDRVKKAVEFEFKIPGKKLYLTHPTFFSRMNNKPAVTSHDEYWHPHIDRKTYPSFYYTSLLYLTTNKKHFQGGEFVFLDKKSNHTIEPKAGRLSFFTSGSENVHRVTPVTQGTRFAITISFTCDKEFAIKDPSG